MKVMELFNITNQLQNTYVNTIGYVLFSHICKSCLMWLLEVHFFLNDFKHVQFHFLQIFPTIFAKLNISTTLGDT
jgi:hypothetical protein